MQFEVPLGSFIATLRRQGLGGQAAALRDLAVGWLMRWVVRWCAVVVLSTVVFAGAWWACQGVAGLDEGAALGIAGAVLAVFLAVAGSGIWSVRQLNEVAAVGGVPPEPSAWGFPRSSARPPTGHLTSPREGAQVDRQEQVTGLVRDLPPGWQPWIVVWPAGERVYWPQGEFPVDRDGGFRSLAYFGWHGTVNVGESFQIRLVLANTADSAQFRAFLKAPRQGLRDLPQDVLTLDQSTVMRR